jgi:hypothetical protein
MATEAAWLECKESTGRKEKTERANRKRKTHLTHTGLLMEGVWLARTSSCKHFSRQTPGIKG